MASGAQTGAEIEAKTGAKAKAKVIFFGNGVLAENALAILAERCEVIFRAHAKEDLARAVELKREFPEAVGVLASFGVLIPSYVLEAFEPEGILNIHPSLLPSYRGASPIESAIIDGASEFSVSVMKLAKKMDAGPVYFQETFSAAEICEKTGAETVDGLPKTKLAIYEVLAKTGAEWIARNMSNLPEPAPQDEVNATFCRKFVKSDGVLRPSTESAEAIFRKILAFQGYPKPKFSFYGVPCTILAAHVLKPGETAALTLPCLSGALAIDRLQPEGRKAMDARSFVNGYKKQPHGGLILV